MLTSEALRAIGATSTETHRPEYLAVTVKLSGNKKLTAPERINTDELLRFFGG